MGNHCTVDGTTNTPCSSAPTGCNSCP
jgi:hypothetical protein